VAWSNLPSRGVEHNGIANIFPGNTQARMRDSLQHIRAILLDLNWIMPAAISAALLRLKD
jgi:hypothetical protein